MLKRRGESTQPWKAPISWTDPWFAHLLQLAFRSMRKRFWQPGLIKTLTKQVGDLIDKKPLAPITEKDFVDDRCTRYPYIYKAQDGRYYNDRAVVFKKSYDDPSSQYIYQGQHRSKQEITLPYVLLEEIVLIP